MNMKVHDLTIHRQEMKVEIPDKYSQLSTVAWTEANYEGFSERIMKIKSMRDEKRSFSFRDDITRTFTARHEIKCENEFYSI